MLQRPLSRRSAGLGDRRRRLGGVDLGLQGGPLGLGREAERLGRGEIALAVLLGGVGRDRQALVALDLVGGGLGLDLPGRGGAGVVAERGVGAGGEDRQIGIRALGQREVVLPVLGGVAQLLLARRRIGVGGGVEAGGAGVVPTGADQGSPGRGAAGAALDLGQRGLLLLADDGGLLVARAPRERVEQAAEPAAGADAEEHESAAHENRETEVDG